MKYLFPIVVALLIFTAGCDDGALFQQSSSIGPEGWSVENVISYEFDIEEKDKRYDMFIDLRNSGSYEYSNLYVFFKLEFPNGKQSVDTVECFLADPTGRWYGSGLGDVYDNRIRVKKGVSFPLNGKYRVSIEQAMRKETLDGILDVGFRLSNSK